MTKKVAVALSGGIDSAVVAALLKEKGYDVVGITGKMIYSEDFEQIVSNAKKVADKLSIKHYIFDVSKDFNEKVIKYFENAYKSGKTPNPCIMCNKYIKWGAIFEYAVKELGVDYIATGHYANIKYENEFYKLYPATDKHKDQLYFLFSLTQDMLSRTLFPLSEYKKEEVRNLAEKYDLPPKSAKESQDICFIKAPMTTKKYLNNLLEPQEGVFVEKRTNKVLGKHNGYWQYTIGQRKGIGLAAPEALYVVDIDASKNVVYVGYQNELFSKTLILENIFWNYPQEEDSFDALVKIRYNMNFCEANVKKANDKWEINFVEPVSAITSGQACVIYNKTDGHLLGGGFIT